MDFIWDRLTKRLLCMNRNILPHPIMIYEVKTHHCEVRVSIWLVVSDSSWNMFPFQAAYGCKATMPSLNETHVEAVRLGS